MKYPGWSVIMVAISLLLKQDSILDLKKEARIAQMIFHGIDGFTKKKTEFKRLSLKYRSKKQY